MKIFILVIKHLYEVWISLTVTIRFKRIWAFTFLTLVRKCYLDLKVMFFLFVRSMKEDFWNSYPSFNRTFTLPVLPFHFVSCRLLLTPFANSPCILLLFLYKYTTYNVLSYIIIDILKIILEVLHIYEIRKIAFIVF